MTSFNVYNYLGDEQRWERVKKRYLFTYNLIQALGWGFVLLRILCYYCKTTENTLYGEVIRPLSIFQIGAIMEYYHAKWKFTKSSPSVTFQQIYSRIYLLCAVLMAVEPSRSSIGLPMLLFAWSVTEIIRYSTYMLSQYTRPPYFLVWLRYTTFIILYPIGVTGELLCMWTAASDVMRTKQWCWEIPNTWNFSFYYHHTIILTMLLYIPFFPKLYLHMFSQRKKVLGSRYQTQASKND